MTTLQSGRFEIIKPIPIQESSLLGLKGYVSTLDVLNLNYDVVINELDTAQNTYVVAYYSNGKAGVLGNVKVTYNYNIGFLEVGLFPNETSMRASEFANHRGWKVIQGNYTYVLPLDE